MVQNEEAPKALITLIQMFKLIRKPLPFTSFERPIRAFRKPFKELSKAFGVSLMLPLTVL
jgi:hypothetical protein